MIFIIVLHTRWLTAAACSSEYCSVFHCAGHSYYVYYQYAVRFLDQKNCTICSVSAHMQAPLHRQVYLNKLALSSYTQNSKGDCFQRVSQCASLGFHNFNVKVRNNTANCTAREMLLLLELQQTKYENGDSVYLQACINGTNKYHFWNYLPCSTITERGGREVGFISCKPNEVLSPVGSSTTVVPNWAIGIMAALGAALVIALVVVLALLACVVTWRYCTGKTKVHERYTQYKQIHSLLTL